MKLFGLNSDRDKKYDSNSDNVKIIRVWNNEQDIATAIKFHEHFFWKEDSRYTYAVDSKAAFKVSGWGLMGRNFYKKWAGTLFLSDDSSGLDQTWMIIVLSRDVSLRQASLLGKLQDDIETLVNELGHLEFSIEANEKKLKTCIFPQKRKEIISEINSKKYRLSGFEMQLEEKFREAELLRSEVLSQN